MRILFLTQFFQPEPIFKGLPFARALRDRGHDVQVLTGFPNYPAGRLYPGYRQHLVQHDVMDGIPVVRVPLFASHDHSAVRRGLNYASFAMSAFLQAVRQTTPPDVLYVYNLVTLGPAARRLRRHHGCPIVIDVQDLWPESILNSGMLRRHAPLTRLLQAWCRREYQAADALTVLSPGFKRHLTGLGVPPERIDVIYNWCDEASLRPPHTPSASDFGTRTGVAGCFNVLFAGTMGTTQALAAVIDAARLLATRQPRIRLTFLGGGVDVPRLQQAAAGLPNVQFLPPCPPTDAGPYLAAADALLVHLKPDPLSSITIPSKIQAYLHAGKPLLCALAGDAADLVRRAGAGLVCEPGNPEGIAAGLCNLAAMPAETRHAMGARGRAFYDAELQFSRGVERFERVFARVAPRRATM